MTAKLKHLAIVSDDPGRLGRFYQELFGLKGALPASPISAASMSDGYLGLNVNFRVPGRQAGLDHFGFEVALDHLDDPRFRGIYFLLAMLLPLQAAENLKEELVQHTVKTNDTTVMAPFVDLLNSRKRMAA